MTSSDNILEILMLGTLLESPALQAFSDTFLDLETFAPLHVTDGSVRILVNDDTMATFANLLRRNGFEGLDAETEKRISKNLYPVITDYFNSYSVKVPKPVCDLPERVQPEKPKRVLMSTPDYRSRMSHPDARLEARAIWEAICDGLTRCGVDVIKHDFYADNDVLTNFTRDMVLIIGDTAFVPDVECLYGGEFLAPDIDEKLINRAKTRWALEQKNAPILKSLLESYDYSVEEVKGTWFEGGNLIVSEANRVVFHGIEGRIDISEDEQRCRARLLEAAIKKRFSREWSVMPLVLPDMHGQEFRSEETGFPLFYHLDGGMSDVLELSGKHFIYPGMLRAHEYCAVQETLGKDKIEEITLEEAEMGVTNFVENGEFIFLPAVSPRIGEKLHQMGYIVVTAEDYGLRTLDIGTGKIRCNTLPLPFLD